MANIGLQELLRVLEKSGVQSGSSYEMGQQAPFVGGQIRQTVQGEDTQMSGLRNNFMAQLAQIAAMDQKLGGVYGDPSSKLFIEHPLQREKARSGARETGYKAAGAIKTKQKQVESELEQKASQAESLFGKLTTAKGKEEAETRRIEREAKRGVTSAGKTERTISGYGEITKGQLQEMNQAGVNTRDAKSVSEWFKKTPANVRNYIIDEVIDGKMKPVKTAAEIKKARQKAEMQLKKEKTKKTKKKSVLEMIREK